MRADAIPGLIEAAHEGKLEEALRELQGESIHIVCGYDRFSYEPYVYSAHLSEDEARTEMERIPPNGSPGLCDTYGITTCMVSDLYEDRARHAVCGAPLDEIDRSMALRDLKERLNSSCRPAG